MDLEKGDSHSAGGSLAGEDRHGRCSCGTGRDYSCCLHYTFGLRNGVVAGMILVSLLFAVLAAFVLSALSSSRQPQTAPAAAPSPASEETVVRQPLLAEAVSVVWTVSLLLCSYLAFWILALSSSMGALAVFFRVSYGALLAFAAAGLVGPAAGMVTAHLTTAWVAGMLGHALAEHRMRTGSERAADEAAARAPPRRSEGQALTVVHCVFTASLVTLALAARVVWLAFFPSYDDENSFLMAMELSILVWTILYFWALLMVPFSLHEALVSMDFMARLFFYYMASMVPSVVCVLVSTWLFVYYFGVEMMAMAAFFGYIIAVHARCKEILAREGRDQPGLLHHGELDDDVEEPISASAREDAEA
ncbi:hypothetical protein ACP70R_004054 [Stipagrostis hirtigluma subsp. patula]